MQYAAGDLLHNTLGYRMDADDDQTLVDIVDLDPASEIHPEQQEQALHPAYS